MAIDGLSMPWLVIVEPAERAGLTFPLSEPQLVIGRSTAANFVIDDPFVSGRHALVMVDDSGQVAIRDLNSTSGTFVNGERVTGARVLEPGDMVRFADVVTRFDVGGPEPAATATQPLPVARHSVVPAPPGMVSAPTPPDGGAPPAIVSGDANVYTVTGTVFSPMLPGIGGLEVQLVDKNVGGDQVLASTRTSSDGTYAFAPITIGQAYLQEHHKQRPDLQVHVSGTSGVMASSAVAYSVPPSVALDVTLPADATGQPSEYEIADREPGGRLPGQPRRPPGERRPAGHHVPGEQDRVGRARRGARRARRSVQPAHSPRGRVAAGTGRRRRSGRSPW